MNQENTLNNDLLNQDPQEVPKMSSALNVLTILSFLGCALQLVGGIWNFINAEKNFKGIGKVVESMNSPSTPGWVKSMLGDPEHYTRLMTESYVNRIPIILLTVVAVALCFYGVLQMRKLKKQGFPLYAVGELLPFVSQALFIGMFSFSGIGFFIGIAVTLLFILLYALQRKSLVY